MTEGKLFAEEDALVLDVMVLKKSEIRGNHYKSLTEKCLNGLIDMAVNVPLIGFSQPWEFVVKKDKIRKQQIIESFKTAPVNKSEFFKSSMEPVLDEIGIREIGIYSIVCADDLTQPKWRN